MRSVYDSYVASALFGILLYMFAVAFIAVAILSAFPSDIYYALIFGLPALIAGLVIWKFRRWGLLFGIVAGIVGLLAVSEGADIYLTTPSSFFDFGVTLFALAGVAIVLLASLIGSIQYFRKQVGDAPGRVPAVVKGVGGVLAVLALVSIVLTVLQIDDVPASEAQGATVITAEKAKWDINRIDAPAGQPVRILVKNTDPIMHTFTIDDLDMDIRIGPWTEKLIVIENLEPRIYGFICRIPGHEKDMTGAIVVE